MNSALLLAALLSTPSFAAPKAPDFKISRMQNAPVSQIKSLADLKGKVVFLEFWATWCPACVTGIPHVNRVIDSLKGESVVFLSVTDEPADAIETFRKTHEMKTWVGIDEEGLSLKAFHVSGRPAGFLISKDGTLLADIFPDDLEEKDIRDALAGRFTPRPVTWEDSPNRTATGSATGKTYFEAKISAASGKPGMRRSFDGLEAAAMPFAQNVAWIWDVEASQVIVDSAPVAEFNFTLKTSPEGFEKGRELLKTAVQSAFGVRVAPEKRETDALVLTLSTAKDSPRPKPGAEGGKSGLMRYGGGRLLGKVPMSMVARALWLSLDKPVVDGTGLAGEYEFDMEWKYGDRAELDRLLAARGLSLVPARRTIDFLRVSPEKP